MSRTICDIVVVGAGVIGCSVAFHLARLRGARVVVVEKGSLASGMTKRSGAFVHALQSHETESRLAQASLRDFQNWKELIGATCGYVKTGCATVANASNAAQLQTISGAIQSLTPQALRDIEPHARIDDLAVAAYEPDAGYVDPIQVTQTLATRAKDYGVTFKTGTQVKSIRVNAGRVAGVETTTGDIEALTVVLASGAWTERLLKPLGVSLGIENKRAQVVFFDRPAELKPGHIAFVDLITNAHFRPHTFGLTMGGLNTTQLDENKPDSFDESVAPSFVDDMRSRIAARLPVMAQARYIRGHAGVYDVSPDGRPFIGKMPGIAGLVVAAGFAGQGLAIAPAVGKCIAEIITDGEASTIDVRALRIDRASQENV